MISKLKVNKCYQLYANLCNYLIAASLTTLGKGNCQKKKKEEKSICVPDPPQTSAHHVLSQGKLIIHKFLDKN